MLATYSVKKIKEWIIRAQTRNLTLKGLERYVNISINRLKQINMGK